MPSPIGGRLLKVVKAAVRRAGWHVGRRNRYTSPFLDGEVHSLFDYQLFRTFSGDLQGLRFVQIGANDGVSHDPLQRFIARYDWTGVLVEPMPAPFSALEARYASNPKLSLVQAAVDEKAGRRSMYYISDDKGELPAFVRAISSFNREHLLSFSSVVPEIAAYIADQEVPCWTLPEILARANLDRVDVLQIDAEGHDDIVLGQVDLDRLHPRLIQFEHRHLSSERLANALLRLRQHGYAFGMEGPDVCATRAS